MNYDQYQKKTQKNKTKSGQRKRRRKPNASAISLDLHVISLSYCLHGPSHGRLEKGSPGKGVWIPVPSGAGTYISGIHPELDPGPHCLGHPGDRNWNPTFAPFCYWKAERSVSRYMHSSAKGVHGWWSKAIKGPSGSNTSDRCPQLPHSLDGRKGNRVYPQQTQSFIRGYCLDLSKSPFCKWGLLIRLTDSVRAVRSKNSPQHCTKLLLCKFFCISTQNLFATRLVSLLLS